MLAASARSVPRCRRWSSTCPSPTRCWASRPASRRSAFTAGDKIGIARVDVLSEAAAARRPIVDRAGRRDARAGQSQELRSFPRRPRRQPDRCHVAGIVDQRRPGQGQNHRRARLRGGAGRSDRHRQPCPAENFRPRPTSRSITTKSRPFPSSRADWTWPSATARCCTSWAHRPAARTSCSRRATCTSACSDGSGQPAVRLDTECASCSGAFYGVSALRPGEAERLGRVARQARSSKCRSRSATPGPICGSSRRRPRSVPAVRWPIR